MTLNEKVLWSSEERTDVVGKALQDFFEYETNGRDESVVKRRNLPIF